MFAVFRQQAKVLGQCRCCGRCCQEIVLHIDGKWIRNKRQFEKLQQSDEELQRFYIKTKDHDGRLVFGCSWLTEEGLCKDYEHRLALCKAHPTPSLYLHGVELDAVDILLKARGWLNFFMPSCLLQQKRNFSAFWSKNKKYKVKKHSLKKEGTGATKQAFALVNDAVHLLSVILRVSRRIQFFILIFFFFLSSFFFFFAASRTDASPYNLALLDSAKDVLPRLDFHSFV